MEAVAVDGWISKRPTPETIDKQGYKVDPGPKTSRIAFSGLEDPRLHVRARGPQKHPSSDVDFIRLDGRDYLPVCLKGNSSVLVDVEDLSQRLHFSLEKLHQVALGERSLSDLLAKRIKFPQVLDSYSKVFKAYVKETARHEGDVPEEGYVRVWDPVYNEDMTQRALMKIVRRAERGLGADPMGHHFQSHGNRVLARHSVDGLQLTLWAGHPFVVKQHPSYLGYGTYVRVQRVFHINAWKTAALKSTYTRGSIAAAMEFSNLAGISIEKARTRLGKEGTYYHFQELKILEYIHSLANVPRTILPRALTTYNMDVNGTHLLGTIWPYYPLDLTDTIVRVQDRCLLHELPRGGLEKRTRRELLEATLELLEALIFLRDVAHVVHGDLKPENILVCEDADGKLHFVIGDWGGAKRTSSYDVSQGGRLPNELGGSNTSSYTSWNDCSHIMKAALDIRLATHFSPDDHAKFSSLQRVYNGLQHGRDLLGSMLTAYLTLGISRAHEITAHGYIDFDRSFGRTLVGEQRKVDQRARRELYGKEIKAMFEKILIPNHDERITLDEAVATIRKILAKADASPHTKLAATLNKTRVQHGP